MIDTKFLNEHATKFRSALKKTKQIIDRGIEEFLKIPMYPDRAKYYIIIAYDELDKIACHLLRNITKEKLKENCLERLVEERVFSARINRALEDFVNFKKKLFVENFNYSDRELYTFLKQLIDELYEPFIKELAKVVKELKEKEPKLSIPVNMIKVSEQAAAIKSTLKKIDVFLKYPEEEFIKSPYAVDRSRYFAVVLIDSALWICRHVSRAAKLPRSKECFLNLAEHGIISKETAEKLQNIVNLRKDLVDPTKEINLKEFYSMLKNDFPAFISFIKEVVRAIYGKKE